MSPRIVLVPLVFLAACGRPVSATRSALTVEPASLDFGLVAPSTHTTRTLLLFNEGTTPLQLRQVMLRSDVRAAFAIGAPPTTLGVGETAELSVTYLAPATPGADVATLVLETDSRVTPEVLVSIAGQVASRDDAGAADAGAPDAGARDSGAEDAGAPDAGAEDAGAEDAGAEDAGAEDAGAEDAGADDAGADDAGVPDAGPRDAGVKYVFTSSRSWDGDLILAGGGSGATGSARASQLCQQLGRDAGLGSFTALITEPGRNLAAFLPMDGPWYRTDGVLVFADRAELLAGTPRVPIDLDEHGQRPTGYGSVWTGLTFGADGGLVGSTRSCSGWSTSNAGTLGTAGSFSATGPNWLNTGIQSGGASSCSTALHLYCIGG